MLPPLPRCSGWASSSLVSPNRVSLPRFHVRIGLHIVLFEVCSAFTRVAACTLARSPYVVTAIRRLQTLRLLHACSGCFRLERIAGWGLHPLEKRRLVTAHVGNGRSRSSEAVAALGARSGPPAPAKGGGVAVWTNAKPPVILVLRVRDGDHRNEILLACPSRRKVFRPDARVVRVPSPR